MTNNNIVEFLNLLEEWKFGYERVLCRYFLSKTGGTPKLLYGMLGLTNEELALPTTRIETDTCIAGQEVFDLTSDFLAKFIASLNDGPATFLTESGHFQFSHQSVHACPAYYDPITWPAINSPMRHPFLRLSGEGDHRYTINQRRLDLELRLLERPYENAHDLLLSLRIPSHILEANNSPHIDYVVSPPTKAFSCYFSDGELLIYVLFSAKPDPSKLSVGIRLFCGTDNDPRFVLKGVDFEWSQEEAGHVATLSIDPSTAAVAKVFPSYANHNLGVLTVFDAKFIPNRRKEVDQVLYGNGAETWLESKDSDTFEFGVATLLHHLRLSVQRYAGIPTLTNGPDLVAHSNSGHVYVVECTTGSVNHKGKLLKLHQRAEKLRSSYIERGITPDFIRPVIVTNLPRENTVADHGELANFGITLVTKDDFAGLIARTPYPPSDQELFEVALSAVPSKQAEVQRSLGFDNA